ncbi:MAG: hemolysin family protein [Holosporales bacterium]|jgi:CBS domain containing-hemolysin-like protein|nr:hemolysin family protein [Holosporales bacterium]
MNLYERIKKLLKWKKYSETTIRDTIEELIEEDASDANGASSIDSDEREMLGNVLDLRDIQVQDIMIPRVEIKALPITAKIDELLSAFVENQISTILVYLGTIDNIVGVVYIKDVVNWFRMNKPFNISMFVKDVIFVPPTMRTLDLLLQMRETGIKIAVVVDEYGGIEGCISFSDLVEEIIGDIQDADEKKNDKKRIIKNTDGTFIVDAKTTLTELSKITGFKFIHKNKSVDSIGGYVISMAGKVPVRGELVFCEQNNIEFEILDADPRKIKSIRIRKIS